MSTDLHDLSIAELSGLIAARKLSPVELVDALIHRVEELDAQTRAFITTTFDLARKQAREAEAEIGAGRYRGALHGIPFALKDIYDTRGILTSGHSRVFIDRIPAEDATATARLYEAGAVLLGKLATHEMAHAGPSFDLPWPPARNPWNLARFTGGSSSGSGAAVAAGMVPVALGSDTGGSIRGPASLCGVVGLMPTFGLVSRAGVITNSYTFDHCGPLARTVEDSRDGAGSPRRLRPEGRGEPASGRSRRIVRRSAQDLRGLRIGVLRHHWEEDMPGVRGRAPGHGRRARCPAPAGRGAHGVPGAAARQLLRRARSSSRRARSSACTRRTWSPGRGTSARTFSRACCPSVLFTANDYVQATREHRRMMVEMAPLYAEVRRLRHRGHGRGAAARRLPQRLVLAEVEPAHRVERDEPARADAAQRLRETRPAAGHAGRWAGRSARRRSCASATPTSAPRSGTRGGRSSCPARRRRTSCRRPCSPSPPPTSMASCAISACRRARRAGVPLDDLMLAQLLEGAPYALEMVRRLRRDHDLHHEPANVFSFPAANH